MLPLRTHARWTVVLALLLALASGCGARSVLDVTLPDAGPAAVTWADAGHDAGHDEGDDAGHDAGVPMIDAGPACDWGAGVVGAWRVPAAGASDAQLPAIFHAGADGRVRSTVVDSRGGGAFGMGVAARGDVIGVSWRVRRDDGGNALYFARAAGGCLIGAPTLVHEVETLQTFRGNLVATSTGWMVFWLADGGLWARALNESGAPSADALRIAAIEDARFTVAAREARVGVLYVEARTALRLTDLAPDGTVSTRRTVWRCADACLEPRLLRLARTWGGVFLDGGRIFAFEVTGATAEVTPLGEACTECVTEPSYLLPAAASAGARIGALWAVRRGAEYELTYAIVRPVHTTVEDTGTLARGSSLRWPALGHDGTRFIAVYDDDSGVNVRFVDGASVSAGVGDGSLVGSQRIPALAAVP